jgi:N-acetylmuramoyl-L-alanine amidase
MTLKIAIDAGHGYSTIGKCSPDGMKEYEFNRVVANAMRDELNKFEGVEILFTHSDARDVPLVARTDTANSWGADVFISLHANASTGIMGDWGGIDTFVYGVTGVSYKLAQVVQRNLIEATGLRNRGVKVANFHVLRETEMPAILIEHGFMDSYTDLPLLKSDVYRKLCGVTNACSVAEFYVLTRKPIETEIAGTPVPADNTNEGDEMMKPSNQSLRDSVTRVLNRLEHKENGISSKWREDFLAGNLSTSDAIALIYVALDRELIQGSIGTAEPTEPIE